MHIEPGILNAAKVSSANAGALATLGAAAPALIKNPALIVKSVLAALFFSVFMEIFHVPVGASELHFVGASAVYLLFGFVPTLFGFALGLALQGLLFEPQDLVHLGVNSLSLMLPLIAAHALLGRRFFRARDRLDVRWATIVRFDALFYTGVVGMVGFWLSLGTEPTPIVQWATFAASYLPLVLIEPLFTYAVLRFARRHAQKPLWAALSTAGSLSVR